MENPGSSLNQGEMTRADWERGGRHGSALEVPPDKLNYELGGRGANLHPAPSGMKMLRRIENAEPERAAVAADI